MKVSKTPRTIRKQLLQELQEVLKNTAEQIKPLLQQEAFDLAEEKREQFHQENPHRYTVARAIFKGVRRKQKRTGTGCLHTKGQGILLKTLGYEVPTPLHQDFNIGQHIFPDGVEKIWCLICGETFTQEEAEKMWTTNRRSQSEIVVTPVKERPTLEAQAIYFDDTFTKELKEAAEKTLY